MRVLMGAMVALWMVSGCSVYMAANSDGKKDLSVLAPGTDRAVVIAELGAPVATDWLVTPLAPSEAPALLEATPIDAAQTETALSETAPTDTTDDQAGAVAATSVAKSIVPEPLREKRERYDLFKFTLERSSGSNAGRAVAYGAAAVLTLGLSEILTTPLEAGVGDAGERRFRVVYDENDKVSRVEIFEDDVWRSVGDEVAADAEADKAAQAEADARNFGAVAE